MDAETEGRRNIDKTLFDSIKSQGDQLNELEVNFGKVEANQKSIFTALGMLSDDVKRLTSLLGSKQTPWMVIISSCSLLLTLVCALGVGFITLPMREIKNNQIKIYDSLSSHLQDGHPNSVRQIYDMRLAVIEKDYDRLVNLVQKQQDWTFEHAIETTDIQSEVRTKLSTLFKQVDRVNEIDNKRASHEERLKNLERYRFPSRSEE